MKILSAFLVCAISSTIAISVDCAIALTSPVLADDYQPPNNGHIKTTKVIDCNRGSSRREDCI